MDETTPAVRWLPALAIAVYLALHVWLRYDLKWGYGKRWQALHVLIGLGTVGAIVYAAHWRHIFRRLDRSGVAVLAVSSVCYLLFWYLGRSDTYLLYLAPHLSSQSPVASIYPIIYLSLAAFFFRLLVPFVVGARLARRRPRDLGLGSGKGGRTSKVLWIYVGLYVAVAPVVWMVSDDPDFTAKYPLARGLIAPDGSIGWGAFLVYQGFYALIFVSGEALYRGFMVFGLERQLGLYAIAFMLVPYVFSHFGKPLPETLGAIGAGTMLAFLALKHRSIWPGVCLHYAVALTMDISAIARQGYRLT